MNVENIVVDIEINNSLAPDIEQSIVATIDNNINVIKDNTDDLDVTINRKEYVITGDEIYIPKRYEDAPTWLQNMIDQVVEYSIGAKVSDMNQVVYSLNQMIEAMEVSKNTYEMSVISSNDIDTRINTAITTLNSNMNDADATILSVANTKTTPEEAEAIMINAVRAELESTEAGTIGAAVATLSTAIANEEEARSTSVETLYSTMEGEFEATATAFNTINTYIGIDEAGASTGTGLSAYIEGDDGTFGSAGSELNNQVVATAEKVESKFSYNSTVKINGVPYTSGFGLATSQIAGSGVPEGDSEFWVTADKFKLRAASQTAASQQPFTVDAVTGDIKFIGTVDFASVEGIDAGVTGILDTNNDDFAIRLGYDDYAELVSSSTAGNTIVKGGYVNTELIEAGAINAGHIDAYAIAGKTITGGTINGTVINGVQINGAIIKGSFIDYTTSLALTNWQEYTASTIPSLYVNNFAHNNDGSLVVDSLGYVRLPGQQNFIVGNVVKSGRATYSVHAINAVYDLYSWNSYKINTLQRSVRQDTQFSSSALLKITANGKPAYFSTTNNWGFSVNFTFLNITYVLSVSAYSSNAHTSAQTHLYANGVEVAGAVGSLGIGLDKPWDSGWIDYNTTVKGIPINFKSEIQYGPISIEISIPISTLTPIVNHDVDDIIKVDSISGYSNPGSNSFYVDYNINFPTIFVV